MRRIAATMKKKVVPVNHPASLLVTLGTLGRGRMPSAAGMRRLALGKEACASAVSERETSKRSHDVKKRKKKRKRNSTRRKTCVRTQWLFRGAVLPPKKSNFALRYRYEIEMKTIDTIINVGRGGCDLSMCEKQKKNSFVIWEL